jgi:four helix bundle protein
MNSNELKSRTKRFALMIIELVGQLPQTATGRAISSQLVRCGTSVGANYRAACRAKSPADFIAKIDIVEEEADESCYWLELIGEGKLLPREAIVSAWREANELTAIFTKISITSKENNPRFAKKSSQVEKVARG